MRLGRPFGMSIIFPKNEEKVGMRWPKSTETRGVGILLEIKSISTCTVH